MTGIEVLEGLLCTPEGGLGACELWEIEETVVGVEDESEVFEEDILMYVGV